MRSKNYGINVRVTEQEKQKLLEKVGKILIFKYNLCGKNGAAHFILKN